MTENKPIIIDGVDVSDCERVITNKIYGYVCNCEEDTHLISSCKNRPNCYFKQLARKTQEIEELKRQIESDKELISDIAKHNYQLFQELDQLKAENNLLKQYKGSKQASYESMQIDWNKAVSQNKDLLKQVEEWQEQYNQLKSENDKLRKERKNDKQKLERIRQIANGIHDMWINKTQYTDVYDIAEHLLKCELNRIINEFDEIDEVE